ncbi:MAG: hypothetical protein HOP28_07815 [Gemmatimonadales bacterium]|nr:hypothetical protein [Gemmatimonadales bacterium]
MRPFLIALAVAIRPAVLPAQAPAPSPAPAPPPCASASHRAFDFWIGEWIVEQKDGARAGTNRIERILGGCVLQENWTAFDGGRGHSFNIYDERSGRWHQTWVDGGGNLLTLDGGIVDGSMVLQGTNKTPAGDVGSDLAQPLRWLLPPTAVTTRM